MVETFSLEVDEYTYKVILYWFEAVKPRLHFEDLGEFLRTSCREYIDPYMPRDALPEVPPKVFKRLAVQAAEHGLSINDYCEELLTRSLLLNTAPGTA